VTLHRHRPGAQRELARALGPEVCRPEAAPPPICNLRCVSRQAPRLGGADDRVNIAADEATIVELSWYGNRDRGFAAWRRVPQPPPEDRHRARSAKVAPLAPGEVHAPPAAGRAAVKLTAHPHLDALLAAAIAFQRTSRASCRYPEAPERRTLPAQSITLERFPLFTVEVRDHIMIAHSFAARSSARRSDARRDLRVDAALSSPTRSIRMAS